MMEDPNIENELWYDAEEPVLYQQPDNCCIYRIPSKLRNVNEAAYTPHLLSIGPFHHGKPELEDMEIHKRIYCENFCAASLRSKDELKRFIQDRQESILGCYAGTINQRDIDVLVEVILVDACFIIELFLMNSGNPGNYYHILRSPWLRKAVEQDLILFENQLPYSLLQDLYDFAMPAAPNGNLHPHREEQAQEQAQNDQCALEIICEHCLRCFRWTHPQNDHIALEIIKAKPVHPFLKISCEFFKDYSKERSVRNGVEPKHFTDLVRHFLCPEQEMTCWVDNRRAPIKSIYDVRKLKGAGVNFRPLKEAGFVIKGDESHDCNFNLACFTNMDLKLTQFRVTDETECVIRNVMALEQFLYPDTAYVCEYFLLMDKLVDTVEDVNLLIENGVIVNKLGCNETVANLINTLCDQIMDDVSCYAGVCEQLHKHYGISFWNRNVATLKRVYFNDLWTGSSTILGLFVLVFSIVGSVKSLKS